MEEILHQLIWRIYHYLHVFIYLRWCRISSINSSLASGRVFCLNSLGPLRNKALLTTAFPLVSLNKALLNPYF